MRLHATCVLLLTLPACAGPEREPAPAAPAAATTRSDEPSTPEDIPIVVADPPSLVLDSGSAAPAEAR